MKPFPLKDKKVGLWLLLSTMSYHPRSTLYREQSRQTPGLGELANETHCLQGAPSKEQDRAQCVSGATDVTKFQSLSIRNAPSGRTDPTYNDDSV